MLETQGFRLPRKRPDMRRGPSKYEFEGPRAGRRPTSRRPGGRRDPRVPPRPPFPARETRALHERMPAQQGPSVHCDGTRSRESCPSRDGLTFSVRAVPASGACPGLPRCLPRPRGREEIDTRPTSTGTRGLDDECLCTAPRTASSTPFRAHAAGCPHPCAQKSWTTHALALINPSPPGAGKRRIDQAQREGVRWEGQAARARGVSEPRIDTTRSMTSGSAPIPMWVAVHSTCVASGSRHARQSMTPSSMENTAV